MAELFNVVFAGEIVGRADPAVVRANVGKLFGASEAVLDKLFSGQPVAIKKMVDRATAMQLRARMKQAGAETRLVQVDEQGQPLAGAAAGAAAPVRPATPPAGAPAPVAPAVAAARPGTSTAPVAPPAPGIASAAPPAQAAVPTARPAAAAPAPAASPATPAAAPAGSMAARLQAQEQARVAPAAPASAAAPAGDWNIKPVGTRLSDPAPPPPPPPDTSAISLKPAGGTLVAPQEIPRPAPVQVDISGLSMAAAGTEVLREDERRQVAPVQVDLSGISMADVGAPLEELREEKPLLNPDTSYLKLAD